MDGKHWEDAIWRQRFRQYRPLELVDFIQRATNAGAESRAVRLAIEELDRQLVAMGCEPRRRGE